MVVQEMLLSRNSASSSSNVAQEILTVHEIKHPHQPSTQEKLGLFSLLSAHFWSPLLFQGNIVICFQHEILPRNLNFNLISQLEMSKNIVSFSKKSCYHHVFPPHIWILPTDQARISEPNTIYKFLLQVLLKMKFPRKIIIPIHKMSYRRLHLLGASFAAT